MRRPRAFTCSRLRAEPLPPPPRKPLGYLHEEGWAIARSSSPCKCGTCGRDSPLSTPPPNSNSQGGDSLRSPEARSFSNMHPWRPSGGTPPRAESPGASLDSRARGNSTARVSASRRAPFAADRSAKPARRIILFNTQPEPLGVTDNAAAAGVSSVGPAERKRASDGAGGDGGSVCGEASSVSWAAYSLASATAAASSLSANSAAYSGAINSSAMDATAAAAASASSSASAASAAFASAASAAAAAAGVACEGRQAPAAIAVAVAAAAAASAEKFVPTFGPLSVASDPIDQAQAQSPAAAINANTNTHKVEDRTSSESFVKGLDAWKAPETAGTFSLGASSQASGVGRRRRALRLRVGG